MNTALILAAGVGQRMSNAGCPKQFLKIMGKPIVVYTIEKFEDCKEIDNIIIVCHGGYISEMEDLVEQYRLKKVVKIVVGGNVRQSSIQRGLDAILDMRKQSGGTENIDKSQDIIVIHDGVRPLIEDQIIAENIFAAKKYGCAITVHPVKESVVITDSEDAEIDDFKERAKTYTMTAPQSFRLDLLEESFYAGDNQDYNGMPLLDAAMVYAKKKGAVHMVKELGSNIKITTPEDFYYLKAILELEEQKYIFGL